MKNLKEIIEGTHEIAAYKINEYRLYFASEVHREMSENIENNLGRDIVSYIRDDLYFTKFLPDRDSPSIAFLSPGSIIG